jgi:hypothetical protein
LERVKIKVRIKSSPDILIRRKCSKERKKQYIKLSALIEEFMSTPGIWNYPYGI